MMKRSIYNSGEKIRHGEPIKPRINHISRGITLRQTLLRCSPTSCLSPYNVKPKTLKSVRFLLNCSPRFLMAGSALHSDCTINRYSNRPLQSLLNQGEGLETVAARPPPAMVRIMSLYLPELRSLAVHTDKWTSSSSSSSSSSASPDKKKRTVCTETE